MLYSTFYLDDKLMGLPIPSILEIGRSFKIHPVKGAPNVIDGLINLRGKVVTIINLGLAFDVEKVEPTEESRIYILKNNSELKKVEFYLSFYHSSFDRDREEKVGEITYE